MSDSRKSSHNPWVTYRVPEHMTGVTVEEVLRGPLMVSRRLLNRLTRIKGIRLNGKPAWLAQKVKTGDRVQAALRPPETSPLSPEPVPLRVVYEDTDLMVIDKPAGVAVHPVRDTDRGTLVHGILHLWSSKGIRGTVRPVHRLDRFTSGLILIAKSGYMHQLLDRQLRNGHIHRAYLAVCDGKPEPAEGVIDAPIGRDPRHPTRRRITAGGDPATTRYRLVRQGERASLVEARPITGRTHQIRVHFAHLGAPLAGDRLYGGDTSAIRRQALHAFELAFTHPLTGEDLRFEAPLPEDMQHALVALGLA
ncbi:RluA family pseudouridine synthase [Staphylospora marina]|uniref:RluA family pseudouridine synthase n=1 Tax=Staphylospora marina TaxID=2490858 RepID=UPI000F5BBCFE|nr:RluA family pseudouridine synthase [Staphylospora marina]